MHVHQGVHNAHMPIEDRAGRRQWGRGYVALVDFVSTHGHSRTPRGYRTAQGFDLGMWVANQRRAYRESTLGADQIERLELLPGWVWEPHSQRWDEMFRAVATHLDTDQEIPAAAVSEGGHPLGAWVGAQRVAYRRGALTAERIARLEALPGWVWSYRQSTWEAGFEALRRYAAEHGRTDVPRDHVTADGFRLGDWVHRQALEINSGRIPLGRYQQLVALRRTCESPTETGESA